MPKLRMPGPPLSTYFLAHLPGWTVVSLLVWALVAWVGFPAWVGLLLVGAVVAKDVVSYRVMRHYYTPDPPERRILDHAGVTVTPLAPRGLVRVRGELWQARIASAEGLPQGAAIRVRDVQGLVLIVEPGPVRSGERA